MVEVKRAEEVYVIMQNETMVLSPKHCEDLGWEEEKQSCFMYADQKRGVLYVIDQEDLMAKLPSDQFFHAKPLVGQRFPIGLKRAVTVSRNARRWLGWEVGDKIIQELNTKIHGIVCQKVQE